MSEWQILTVEEATSKLIDYRGKTPPKTTSGIRLVTAKVVKQGRVLDSKKEFIAVDFYDDWMRRGLPKQWDVLITTEAPLGEVAILRTPEKIALAQRIILLRGDPEIINQRYYYYALQSEFTQGELRSRASGTTVLGIKQSELRLVRLNLPPLPTQRKIAGTLSAYDDLIENNLRRIKILEDMAQSLYREWFVHFRFPGHESTKMIDSPLGPIPEGWEVKKLVDECDLTMGQSPKSEFYNDTGEGTPFHQGVTNFGDYFPTDRLYSTKENRIAEESDILFSVRAPVGRINVANKRIVIGRGVSSIRSKESYQIFFLFQLKHQFAVEDSMGNGAIFKAVTKADMQNIKLISPGRKMTEDFESIAIPLFGKIKNLTERNQNLRETRDLLLPKLLTPTP